MRNAIINELLLLLFFLPILLLLVPNSAAASSDTLLSGQSLGINDTLTSANRRFLLSFFNPSSSSSNHYYLALSYRQVPDAYLWVANRDNPATDPSVSLVLSSGGNLSLDENSSVILHLFKSSPDTPNTDHLLLKLEDNGDLVLLDPESRTYLWRGFNHMTDTLLPGMYMSLDLRTKKNHDITSWRSPGDPSTGDVSFSIRQGRGGAFEVYLMSPNGTVYYRPGPWNGFRFSGHVGMYSTTKSESLNYYFVVGEKEVTYSYKAVAGETIIVRLYVLNNGVIIRDIWNFLLEKWVTLWTLPSDYCDFYARCGNNGFCENDQCGCLPGFHPKYRKISGYNIQEHCVRKESLPCGDESVKFVKMKGMKLPDTANAISKMRMSLENCRTACERDCSCTAYALNNSTGKGVGCFMWHSDLVDARRMGGTELDVLYVKLKSTEKSDDDKDKLSGGAVAGIVVGLIGGIILLNVVVYYVCNRC